MAKWTIQIFFDTKMFVLVLYGSGFQLVLSEGFSALSIDSSSLNVEKLKSSCHKFWNVYSVFLNISLCSISMFKTQQSFIENNVKQGKQSTCNLQIFRIFAWLLFHISNYKSVNQLIDSALMFYMRIELYVFSTLVVGQNYIFIIDT